jgi:integrase
LPFRIAAGYKLVTNPKSRPYRKDFLTRSYQGGNWYLQFRVPTHLKGTPPFGDKDVFRRSLRTKDHSEAVSRKDVFLRDVGYFDPINDRAERDRTRSMTASDHYWDVIQNPGTDLSEERLSTFEDEFRYIAGDLEEQGIGESSAAAQYQAAAQANHRLIEERRNSPMTMAQRPHAYEITLQMAVDNYANEMRATGKPAKTTAKLIMAHRRLVGFIGETAPLLRDIRRTVIAAHIRDLRSKGLARVTVSNDMSFLGQAFHFAQETGYLSSELSNPFRSIRLVGFKDKESRLVFDRPALTEILKRAKADPDLIAAIYVGYYTGMRISEVFTARLNPNGWVWSVAEEGGKTAAARRYVPAHPKLVDALADLGILPTEFSSIAWKTSTADAIGKRFGRLKREVLSENGIPKEHLYNFHSLRHGFVTMLVEHGHNELEIADLTGHAKSTFAQTEAGKTYLGPQRLEKLKAMIGHLTAIPAPAEL